MTAPNLSPLHKPEPTQQVSATCLSPETLENDPTSPLASLLNQKPPHEMTHDELMDSIKRLQAMRSSPATLQAAMRPVKAPVKPGKRAVAEAKALAFGDDLLSDLT